MSQENLYEPGKEFNVLKTYLEKCNSGGNFSFKESSEIYNSLNNMGRYIEFSVGRLNEVGGQIEKFGDYDKIKINLITKNLELNNLKNAFNNKVLEFDKINKVNELYKNALLKNNMELPNIEELGIEEI